jgi:hypothetical protein
MSVSLTDFLVDLASDPVRMARFTADLPSELENAHLTSAEKAAVMTQDSRRVAEALGGWAAAKAINHDQDKKKKGGKKGHRGPAKKKRPGRPARKKR